MKRYHHKYTLPAIITLLILAIAFLLIGFFNFKRQTTLIVPAVNSRSSKYLKSMSKFVGMLQQRNKKVMVEVDQRYRRYFDNQTMLMSENSKAPSKLKYSFWRYTTNGRVKNVDGLEKGITMYAYNGTVSQYKERYGQLTQ